ncbi:hypothetical protein ACJX0J_017824, partial [Zea mays]
MDLISSNRSFKNIAWGLDAGSKSDECGILTHSIFSIILAFKQNLVVYNYYFGISEATCAVRCFQASFMYHLEKEKSRKKTLRVCTLLPPVIRAWMYYMFSTIAVTGFAQGMPLLTFFFFCLTF